MNQTIKIDDFPPSLNQYRNMHYQKLNNEKKDWAVLIKHIVKKQKISPVGRIDMVYEFFFATNGEHDPDNYACCAKFINDGLVHAGILARDNFKHIRSLKVEQGGVSRPPYILLHMREVNDDGEESA